MAEVSTATRSRRRRLVSAVGIALLVPLASCSGDDGSIAVGDRSTTSAPSTTDAAAATTTPAADGFVSGSYLEETRPTPGEVTLTLHDPDGSAVRTVYSAPTYTVGDDPAASPILDAELAPDGGVFVVERTDRSPDAGLRPGGTRLAKVAADGTATTVKANVVASELSPDGSHMAIVVLSPDGDGDGSGTQAIRVIDLATGSVDELWATDVPLDETGVITVEIGSTRVVGWIADESTLIVEESCCDSGAVMLLPSSGRSAAPETWPAVRGDHATYALGTDAEGRVLVQRTVFDGDGIEVPMSFAGIEVVALAADGTVSEPLYTERATEETEDRVRFDLIGDQVPGTVLPIAAQGPPGLFGAADERTPRRFT